MRELRIFRILIILAGVMGADGVILAAAATHQGDAAPNLVQPAHVLVQAGQRDSAALCDRRHDGECGRPPIRQPPIPLSPDRL